MKIAIVSVSDKTNLALISDFLLQNDYSLLSTGGSYRYLMEHTPTQFHHRIQTVENFTGFPEILEGRVKTLHPKIYGGLLYDPSNPQHHLDYEKFSHSNHGPFNLEKIDMVVCNLYPFASVAKNPDKSPEEIIENIDIGGVSLIRAGAKNYKNVSVLCDPNKYQNFIENYQLYMTLELFKKKLACQAWEHVALYDQQIASHFNPQLTYRKYSKIERLKYGCNPYQDQAFLSCVDDMNSPIEILNGSPGYINFLDAFQSWLLVSEATQSLGKVCVASFKHTAPAGVAICGELNELEGKVFAVGGINVSESPVSQAFVRCRNCDPLSSFGDFIAVSGIVDDTCAMLIKREVSDGIIALGYTDEALKILKGKKGGKFYIIRGKSLKYQELEFREIFGMALSQTPNRELVNESYLEKVVNQGQELTEEKKEDLILATITLKYTPSNSISYAYRGMVIGVGAGQQNRVDCIKLAGQKSRKFLLRFHPRCVELLDKFNEGVKRQEKVNAILKYIQNDFHETELENWKKLFSEEIELLDSDSQTEYLSTQQDLSLSSDAFMPFRDNVDTASKYGVGYIIQPGGSVQDESVIEATREYGMTMVFSGKRMFLH